ncbi:hypothetical protein PV08_05902 [Exophiala spinifera]|uniref:Phosphatidic acid phosphatase type 2/haloperoxidase domain-containing protein n=1 Tax=Exophiala spinifera TaxID=91928 RepID=A0A0D1ZSQ3_9EURO|nr:uncharacterized protein PV08_05902 [Exophiala spinifera]KIW15852.1 hypothetical protein PV08_05902 [Exophiala spinifera]
MDVVGAFLREANGTDLSLIVVAAAGGVLNYISGFHRPFSLTDTDIAYPNKPDIVSLPVLIIVALVLPAAIIALVNLFTAAVFESPSRPHRFRKTLWEIHVGWLGLCAGLAVTLFVTSGLKDMVGKPRPHLLAVCQADTSRISEFTVGGFGVSLDSEAAALVSSGICQQSDKRQLDDGFAAFPSGHSSFSSAGMVYLSLWLCARFSLSIPYLDLSIDQLRQGVGKQQMVASARTRQAAPPMWQFALAFAPIVAALFICSSRYADFHHSGFDIICGAVIGSVFGWASFKFYHLPIRRGHGLLTWGPRARRHAWIYYREEDEVAEDRGGVLDYELGAYGPGTAGRVQTGSSGHPILP